LLPRQQVNSLIDGDSGEGAKIMAGTIPISKRLFLLIFVPMILPSSVQSQQQRTAFETLPLEQGAAAQASCILQDRTGFLWIGTADGLYRYDGYGFISYKNDLADTSSINCNTVLTLFEDDAGVLWVGITMGLERFDRASGTFKHYPPNPSSHAVVDVCNRVYHICEGKDGALWIGTAAGLRRFDRVREEYTNLRCDSTDLGSVPIEGMCEDGDGSLWIGTATGLTKCDIATWRFRRYWSEPATRHVTTPTNTEVHFVNTSEYSVNTICGDDSGTLWLGTNGGLVEYDTRKDAFRIYRYESGDPLNPQHPENLFTSICRDAASGALWIGSPKGLLSFDTKSKKFVRLLDEGILSVCYERSRTLWVGTFTELKKLNRTKPPFRKCPMGQVALNLVKANDGKIWVYTLNERGWLQFDPRRGQFVPYSSGTDFLCFVCPEGDLAFRTREGSFYIRDTCGNRTFFLGPSWKAFSLSLSFVEKTRRGYYVGTSTGGLYLLDPTTQRITEVKVLGREILYSFEDSFGLLWLAPGWGGLLCYDQAQDTLSEYVTDKKHPNPGRNNANSVYQICEDKKGRLWFASWAGLFKFERSTKDFSDITEASGLPGSSMRGIQEDDHGCLWLNTSKGIAKYDPEADHFMFYDVSYGLDLPSDKVSSSGCKTGDGEILFAGANGLTRFHPDSIEDNLYVPPVVITSFRKFDKPYPLPNEVQLAHDDNFISFEFAALNYLNGERNQYAYKMEGVDEAWIHSGTRRYVSYPNLNPGEYIFRVKGSNNEGLWNETGTSVTIVISPPWWRTMWAYAAYVSLFAGALFGGYRLRLRQIRLQQMVEMEHFQREHLADVDRLKSRFFANISHEFRTPLTLVLGPLEKLRFRFPDKESQHVLGMMKRNAHQLLGLVNQLLDLSKLEAGEMKLHACQANIVPFVRGVAYSFESLAGMRKIDWSVSTGQDEIQVCFDKDKLEKILTNLLSNAFKFTPEGGKVTVTVTAFRHQISDIRIQKSIPQCVIVVSDTGIGIPEDKLPHIFDRFYQVDDSATREQGGTGIGLALAKELVELHRGTIRVAGRRGVGTEFTVSLPLGREHLKPDEIVEGTGEEETVVSLPEAIREGTVSAPELRATPDHDTRKSLVLIVEDNADVRQYIKDSLPACYSCTEAVDGVEGIDKAKEAIPDLIISDVMMPKKDGYELCRTLKNDERTSHIPIILLTAKAASENKIEGLETGADDYLIKPFEPKELLARVKNLIDMRRKLRARFNASVPLKPGEVAVTSIDDAFLRKAMRAVEQHMGDEQFRIDELSADVGMSRSQLHRKLVALTNQSPGEFIRYIRLHRALQLLQKEAGTVSEIAYTVGFRDPSHFAKCFRRQFGVTPGSVRPNRP
jgi:signal transduction histidine kinase/DNA-binding response OmpR family regulator/ligand-binding sensor domain-containing protein